MPASNEGDKRFLFLGIPLPRTKSSDQVDKKPTCSFLTLQKLLIFNFLKLAGHFQKCFHIRVNHFSLFCETKLVVRDLFYNQWLFYLFQESKITMETCRMFQKASYFSKTNYLRMKTGKPENCRFSKNSKHCEKCLSSWLIG